MTSDVYGIICKREGRDGTLPDGINGEGKGKATPLQAWTGLEGSRSLRLPYFKTIGT
jgi:hypothetical protein